MLHTNLEQEVFYLTDMDLKWLELLQFFQYTYLFWTMFCLIKAKICPHQVSAVK